MGIELKSAEIISMAIDDVNGRKSQVLLTPVKAKSYATKVRHYIEAHELDDKVYVAQRGNLVTVYKI